jgi:hypothetical protein
LLGFILKRAALPRWARLFSELETQPPRINLLLSYLSEFRPNLAYSGLRLQRDFRRRSLQSTSRWASGGEIERTQHAVYVPA